MNSLAVLPAEICVDRPLLNPATNEQALALLETLSQYEQREMPVTHHFPPRFTPGVVLREIFMPADTYVVGHVHKTHHFNIVLSGRAKVAMNRGDAIEVKAGDVFDSGAGVQKWLYIMEDMRWITVHANPTDERDVVKLEESWVEMSPEFLAAKGGMDLDTFRMSVNPQLKEAV